MTIDYDINIYLDPLLLENSHDLVMVDLRKESIVTDFFIICHCKSTRQVVSIAERVKKKLKTCGFSVCSFEGVKEGNWIILDYGMVVIHIFYEPFRFFYNLEEVWSKSRIIKLNEIKDMIYSDHNIDLI